MSSGPPRRRRARPVADAPVDALLGRSEDLAKGWLLALLEQAPLDSLPAILAADLARDGPRLCDAVVRALADDTDLRRLEAGGALEPLAARASEIAGAATAYAAMRAVDALHAVVWGGVREELGGNPDPEQVAELAERLALVTELVRMAALTGVAAAPREAPAVERPAAAPEQASEPEPGPHVLRPLRPEPALGEPASAAPAPAAPAPPGEPASREPESADPPPAPPAPDRQALWVGALEEELTRSERSGAPLSLLLAELEDADRMLAIEAPRCSGASPRPCAVPCGVRTSSRPSRRRAHGSSRATRDAPGRRRWPGA
jgi:hypothetical protein